LSPSMTHGSAFTMPQMLPAGKGIARQYVDVSRGRVHLRRAGNGGQLVMAFLAGAGSSSNLDPLVHGLSDEFTVVAPDYIGQGDSCRAMEPTDVAQLATDAKEIAAALGFEQFHLYGTHTGAGVAIELAIAEPARVGAVVIDGISMTPPAERAEHRALYFPDISPDLWGMHLLKAWNVRRDGGYFWPWFKPVQAFARKGEAPTLPLLHDRVVSTLRSRSTPAYQAIASYDPAARLPLLKRPTLFVAGPNDTFAAHLPRAQAVAPPNVHFARVPATVWMTGQAVADVTATLQIFSNFFQSNEVAG
jgi:pimeloyl-ACP methyl ester carboxylesterase